MKVIVFTCVAAVLLAYCLIDNFDPSELKGKNVFIAGASTGIGEEMAYHYAKLGANVIVSARKEARLQEVVRRCKELSSNDAGHDYVKADFGELATLEKVTQKVLEKLKGRIDVLVLNHAYPLAFGEWIGNSENMTVLHKFFDVNFKSFVYLASYFLPHLEKTDGQIIVSSSTVGKFASPFIIHYSSSKFAVEGFFGGLRQELVIKQSKISVTVCVIGFIATDSAVKTLLGYGMDSLVASGGADSSETAMAMIKGGALRQREVFVPYLETKTVTLFRDIAPGVIEAFNRGNFG